MKIHNGIVRLSIKTPVATIGVFDGVHQGHLAVLNKLTREAKKFGGESVVISFWPHPRLILDNYNDRIKLLNTLEEKQILLENAGIDHLVIIPFTKSFARISAKKFIKKYLVKKIAINHLLIGFNHQFGRNRKGNFDTIKKYSQKYGFSVEQLDARIIEEEKVSSSIIRKALEDGNLKMANKYLGYFYILKGIIIEGNKLGRSIGFPTANIETESVFKLIPKNGVYAVFVKYQNDIFKGMLNIGVRPTIQSRPEHQFIEVHIIDFNKEIYNEKITLIFVSRIRDEKKFENLEALKVQLEKDKIEILNLLNQYKNLPTIINNI